MSIARHHAEWLSLVPVSGPFLSLPVLMEAFNAGLEPHDAEHFRLLRQAYTVWHESTEKRKSDPIAFHQWIKFVLAKTLDLDDRVLVERQAIPQSLQVEVPEHHELLRPSFVLIDPNTKKPRLLIQTYPRSQELTSYASNSLWKASPDTRMTELLHATGVRLGLVTNGEHWMLVDAPKGETTGYASWYASLWLEEHITLRAFRSFLSASRFFNVPDDQMLEALLTKSASNQQEVTEQLGYQVRRAVEVLIHSLDRADQDFGRELLAGVKEDVLYESALTVMMRLVFLFCAEERELIPSKPFPVYEQNYSVATISKQLRELADQHGEELLERRYDAWPRLLAAFRAVYGGLQHDEVHIPAYGGNLFNPDRFPFLEGRKLGTSWRDSEASPLPVNNRTVLHLLEALQLLQVKVPGGGPAEARRLSFRALDIEQIGHVYEGLLDHTAKRATEPFLGLAGTRDKEPEIALTELERLRAKGEADLVRYLKEETGKSESALKKALSLDLDPQDAARFRTACQGDESMWKRVERFAGLVRLDTFGYPVVIPKGSVFVTAGADRRSSGTHYTPRELTEPIVKYTLEPLVYVGPAEGKPRDQWTLKPAKELLELKICDMACGSGAFLVQAARYMAERLLEAWDKVKESYPGSPRITPEGALSSGKLDEALVPDDPNERKIYAMRIIAQRCLYGVDKNPLAAEMAKLSLWLLTLAKDKPFEFLDHAIRCGDSLVGLNSIDQLRHFNLKPDADDAVLFKGPLDSAVDEAISLRLRLEEMPANTVEDIQRQERLLADANEKIARLRCAADLLVAAEFWGENAKDRLERVRHAAVKSGHYVEKGPTEEFEQLAATERLGQTTFHWPLEFPEVIVNRGGFDGFIGNPPFMGGTKISGHSSRLFVDFLLSVFPNSHGKADICSYFVRQPLALLNRQGCAGFITTNTLTQGASRETALRRILEEGGHIYAATPSMQWPGNASVQIALLHYCRTRMQFSDSFDDTLHVGQQTQVFSLECNKNLAFIGTVVIGKGFEVDAPQVTTFGNEREIIKPYINGSELNKFCDLSPRRWIIDFGSSTLAEARAYPRCFSHVEKNVLPQRLETKGAYREYWWRFGRRQEPLYRIIKSNERVLVVAQVGKHLAFAFLPPGMVYDQKLIVFTRSDWASFAVLQSTIHYVWARRPGSLSLRTDPTYTVEYCSDSFCWPSDGDAQALQSTGEGYYAYRTGIMANKSVGLTDLYNRFHDQNESAADIQKLRGLHVEMDQAVAAGYGWTDFDLGHGFHETKQGIRFTISESSRGEVLQRLLKLNHERYAEEVKQGLHKNKTPNAKKAKKKAESATAGSLFGDE
jgi:hypothetical protein